MLVKLYGILPYDFNRRLRCRLIGAARERIAAQEAAGINLHQVSVAADSPAAKAKVYERLVS